MDDQTRHATRLWTLAVPAVSAFVTSILNDFNARDEVIQETAVAVIESFDRYDPARPFLPWAIAIAHNQARLFLRRKSREKVVFDSEAMESLAGAFATEQSQNDRLEYLAECIGRLDEHSRKLCRLRYQSDMKAGDIGKSLGIAPNTVSKTLQRIRDRLRECVEGKVRAAEVRT